MFRSLRQLSAVHLIVLATVAASFKGVFAKLSYLEGGTPLAVVVIRTLIAAPIFWWIATRDRTARPAAGRRDYVWALVGGGLYLLSAALDLMAVQRVGAGPSRVLLHTFPMFVLLLETQRDRTLPSSTTLLSFAIGWLGLAVMLWPADTRDLYSIGSDVGYSLAAAATFALYLHVGERQLKSMGSRRYTAWIHGGMLVVLLGLTPWIYPANEAADLTLPAIGWVAVLVLISTVPPILLMLEGIRRTSAGQAGLISQVGPMVGLLAAWWLFDEALGLRQLLGAGLVLAGVGLLRGGPRQRNT